ESWLTVKGNQDRALHEATDERLQRNPTLAFVVSEVGREGVEWCQALPATAELEDVLLCHGTPASDEGLLLEEVESGYPRLREPAKVREDLEAYASATLVLCGHTHLPRAVQLPGGPLVVNPGSVGLPAYDHDVPCFHRMESGSPHASYAIAERRGGGPWSVEHFRIPYPHEEAARRAGELGRPDWQKWIRTGFAR
ncbi:MAG: metallophosphoesterase family protein, partial [Acidobacteria bacterium]|nr:metallophosphoesterase family protein [Acidobacteriota bacterium]